MRIILILVFGLVLTLARAEISATNTVSAPSPEAAEAAGAEAIEEGALKNSEFSPPDYPTNVLVEPDVAYLGSERRETADIFSPLQMPHGLLPAILIIHGGGFNDGDKARPREINLATNLVLHGYVCMSINYKLCKRAGQVTWPQSLYDAKAAVRWLRKNADRLQIDSNHIGVIGCSAGGNLAAMLALTQSKDGFDLPKPNGEFSSAVSCAVDFYGMTDLMRHHDLKMFAKTRAQAPELYQKASPVTYAHKDAAPMLIVHGSGDTTVPASQSRALAQALAVAGAEHRLVIVPGAQHSFDLQSRQHDLRPLVFRFFDEYLKGQGAVKKMVLPADATINKITN
jgi:acetyl esterase/lipase